MIIALSSSYATISLKNMKDTELINLLRSLSLKEIKELDKAVASPFFNTKPTISNFYKQIRKFFPGFEHRNLNKQRIFTRLYPGEKFKSQRIRGLSSELKKIVDDYMLFKSVKKNPVGAGFIKIEEFLSSGMPEKEIEKGLKQINTILETQSGINEAFLRNSSYYENLNVQYYLRTEQQQFISESLQEGFAFFLYHFFMRLAYFLHDVTVNKIIFNNKESKEIINKLAGAINYKELHKFLNSEKEKTKYNRAVNMYVLAIINNLDPEDLSFYEPLMSAVSESISCFDRQEKYNIYQMIEAICWHKMPAANNEEYRKELFRINKMRLEDGVFSPDGKVMRLMLYRQILMTAIYLKEYEWAEDFVEVYSVKLPPGYIKNMQNFSFAHIWFGKQEYGNALGILNKVDFDIFTLNFDTRNLMLKIYYELNYFEEAFSLVDSYRHFISKNKLVSAYYKELTLEFLHYYSWLYKIKLNSSHNELTKLKDSLIKKTVYFSKWMGEKIGELEKKQS